MKYLHNIFFLNIPASLEERHRVTVRAWGVVTIHNLHYLQYLPILKHSHQPIGIKLTNRIKKKVVQLRLPIELLGIHITIKLHNVLTDLILIGRNVPSTNNRDSMELLKIFVDLTHLIKPVLQERDAHSL